MRLYCEWRQMIEDKVVADISDEVLEFVKPNIFERKCSKQRPVKNRLLRNYTT
jgi:hypothetical protein